MAEPVAGVADEGDAAVAGREQMFGRLAGAGGIIDADIGDPAVEDRFEHGDRWRQARPVILMAEGFVAGEQHQAGRLVRS